MSSHVDLSQSSLTICECLQCQAVSIVACSMKSASRWLVVVENCSTVSHFHQASCRQTNHLCPALWRAQETSVVRMRKGCSAAMQTCQGLCDVWDWLRTMMAQASMEW